MKLRKILALVLTLAMLFTSAALILPVAAEEEMENYEAEVIGASIRTAGTQGLRFIGKIRKDADVHPGEGANFGFLLIPATMVGSTTVWDEENKVNTVTSNYITSGTSFVKTVPAVNLMTETAVAAVVTDYAGDYDEFYYFTAVITNIPETFYGTEILARIYVTAHEVTTYSNQISRSVQYVANAINEMGGDVSEFITDVLAAYELYGEDIFVNADQFAEEFWATQFDPGEEPVASTLSGDYKYVAIIGVDGAGAFFQQASTPNIDAIFADGAVTYTARTENPSSSGPCWGSLLHGVAPEVHGVDNSNINSAYPYNSAYPSIFRVIREADANVKLASFAQWGEISTGLIENGFGVNKVYVPTATPGIHTDEDGNQCYADSNGKIDYAYKNANGDVCLNYRDLLNKNMICDYLDEEIPTLMFVQFGGVDYAGEHGGVSWAGGSSNNSFNGGWGGFGSNAYLQQITITDGYIGEIYAKYEAAGVLEDTLFIVTADHGGTGYTHGGTTDAEMNIMFAISGKTVKQDCAFENMRIRDTAAIVAEALGVTAPAGWSAKVPEDLFETNSVSGNSFGAYKYVAVIGVDGGGSFFKNTSTPNIDSIFANGATTYNCYTPVSISAQSWGSMLHGVTADYHKLTNSSIASNRYPTNSDYPSIFRVIREAKPSVALASIVGWPEINYGIVEEGFGVTKLQGNSTDDSIVRDQACNYLDSQIPTFLFIQYDHVDDAGHTYGWGSANYYTAIQTVDEYIGDVFAKYEEAGVLNDTLFILTADHGGSGTGHGGSTDDHTKVLLAVRGKTVVNGTIGEVENRDIAAIVAYALGIEQPAGWTSRVPSGLFADVTAQDRPLPPSGNVSARYHVNQDTPANALTYLSNNVSKSLYLYLPLDGDATDATGNKNTSTNGKLYFGDDNGYYGGATAFDDGYISVSNYYPGTNDFSISFWINTYGTMGDPAILANKDWASGTNSGWVLALHTSRILFNFGNGSSRRDIGFTLPSDYQDGWVHVVITVNHSANQIKCYYDFVEQSPEYNSGLTLVGTSLTSGSTLCIGQDALGHEPDHLPAYLDDVMIFNGVLTSSDVAALKTYYGK